MVCQISTMAMVMVPVIATLILLDRRPPQRAGGQFR